MGWQPGRAWRPLRASALKAKPAPERRLGAHRTTGAECRVGAPEPAIGMRWRVPTIALGPWCGPPVHAV